MKFQFWKTLKVMRLSAIAFVISFICSLFSLGVIGKGLFSVALPILNLFFPDGIDSWSGDWVRPVMICVPIVWSFGFLIAGRLYLYLEKLEWTKLTLQVSYIVVLLLWNLMIWFVLFISIKPELS